MINAKCARVGILAIALGVGAAAMTHQGIASADPTAEPSPGVSQVEGPVRGVPDSKTGLGVVSSGGSTPPAGASSVAAGSGSDSTSGPDQAVPSSGSTGFTSAPSPGVVISSSGGALTSHGSPTQSPAVAPAQDSSTAVVATPVEQVPTTTTEATPPEVTPAVTPASTPAATPVDEQIVVATTPAPPATTASGTNRAAGAKPSALPAYAVASDAASIGPSVGGDLPAAAIDYPTGTDGSGVVMAMAAPVATDPVTNASTGESSPTLVAVLAAALAPFVVPLPGHPVDSPPVWAVLAWARRQSEQDVLDDGAAPVADPRQTERVETGDRADTRAIVDRIDPVSGRITGHVDVEEGGGDGLGYALVGRVDRRLGVVAVDAATGCWTFTPNPKARLNAQLTGAGTGATFAIAASNGATVDVRAPVRPAEAAATGTIDVGEGLTYGMAVVGDRLYVLKGSDDAAGNGTVRVVDTTIGAVVGTIEVGSMPYSLASSGRTLYVGNADDGTVSVVDVLSNRVVDVIPVGANPFGLEVTGNRLYVADHAGTVSVIDVSDNTELARITVDGDPFAVAATADRVYVTDYAGSTVAVVDQATNSALDPTAGAAPFDPSGYPYFAAVLGGRLYVVNAATNALTIVDGSTTTVVDVAPRTRAIDALPGGAAPVDVVVRGDRLYVGNVNRGTVVVVDAGTNQPVATIGVGIQPGAMAATPDGRTIYVADVMGATVRVITSVRHAAR